MKRLPYDIVEIKVRELTEKLANTIDLDEQFIILDEIDAHVELCGWSIEEWQEETLRRINNNWSEETKSTLLN